MDGPSNASARQGTQRNGRTHAPAATEATDQINHDPNNNNITENVRAIIAEDGLLGVIMLLIFTPLLVLIMLFGVLLELNKCMGNIAPPWYKMYMDACRKCSAPVLDFIISVVLMLLDALCVIFNRALLTKLFLIVPLTTVILHGRSFLRGESGVLATLVANDLIYLVIDVMIRGIGRFEHSGIAIFILIELVFGMGSGNLIKRD
ncbi:hypothetical protein EPUS_03170 [Endocarpon pusillum Z07020]|uniref:Uncharacterized protein n=1 Tax=Endocarpon pusillum (strain Z07020 / HMAS-L-300199) TaxID=1263415 RepID=U1GS18_ENDPU|nr:uncharacterized protein EPUS_03170 [Endocarpon pusillum Z07020]ERF74786.1 hypothetical protein EPUS_03170 [Endocarpon pusillum Z07020]